jgi:hypothetical protein
MFPGYGGLFALVQYFHFFFFCTVCKSPPGPSFAALLPHVFLRTKHCPRCGLGQSFFCCCYSVKVPSGSSVFHPAILGRPLFFFRVLLDFVPLYGEQLTSGLSDLRFSLACVDLTLHPGCPRIIVVPVPVSSTHPGCSSLFTCNVSGRNVISGSFVFYQPHPSTSGMRWIICC